MTDRVPGGSSLSPGRKTRVTRSALFSATSRKLRFPVAWKWATAASYMWPRL